MTIVETVAWVVKGYTEKDGQVARRQIGRRYHVHQAAIDLCNLLNKQNKQIRATVEQVQKALK